MKKGISEELKKYQKEKNEDKVVKDKEEKRD